MNPAAASAARAATTSDNVKRRLCVSAASTMGTSSRIAMTSLCCVTASAANVTISSAKAAAATARERTISASGSRDTALRMTPCARKTLRRGGAARRARSDAEADDLSGRSARSGEDAPPDNRCARRGESRPACGDRLDRDEAAAAARSACRAAAPYSAAAFRGGRYNRRGLRSGGRARERLRDDRSRRARAREPHRRDAHEALAGRARAARRRQIGARRVQRDALGHRRPRRGAHRRSSDPRARAARVPAQSRPRDRTRRRAVDPRVAAADRAHRARRGRRARRGGGLAAEDLEHDARAAAACRRRADDPGHRAEQSVDRACGRRGLDRRGTVLAARGRIRGRARSRARGDGAGRRRRRAGHRGHAARGRRHDTRAAGLGARRAARRPCLADHRAARSARGPHPRAPARPRPARRRSHRRARALGVRLRIGYGKLTIYLGSVAGSGKTYTMLDRAHQLIDDGVDVVAALVETHGRAETAAQLTGIEHIPRLPNGEIDLETLLLRHPQVALIDELAHTNLSAGARAKRYDDVIAVLRGGIDVITTLNVQHFEGVADAVERLTGTRVRETLPDSVLEFADEVIFVDVTPDVLRQRLREGKIYPRERIDTALSHFFRTENLAALRELAVREMLRARSERRRERPFARIVLGVAPRERDVDLIERAGRLARRLDVDLRVVAITPQDDAATRAAADVLARATTSVRVTFVADVAPDPAVRIVQLLAEGDVLAVESPRHAKRRFFGKPSFAVLALAAGARELLVLAPRAAANAGENAQK